MTIVMITNSICMLEFYMAVYESCCPFLPDDCFSRFNLRDCRVFFIGEVLLYMDHNS